MPRMSSINSGYTITELLIVMAIGGLVIGLIFGPFDSLYRGSLDGLRTVIQAGDTRAALRQIEPTITQSARFLVANNHTDNSTAPATTWNWQGAGADNRVLITENYGTDPATDDGTTPLRLAMEAPACNVHQTFNYVYFVHNNTLFRRTLKNNSYPSSCGGVPVSQKRTCSNLTSNPTYCQGTDTKIVDGVVRFHVDYFESPGAAAPMDNNGGSSNKTEYTSASSTVPAEARTIVITITIRSGAGTNTIDMSSRMRITRVNGATI